MFDIHQRRTAVRPYGRSNRQDPVEVIGHDAEHVDVHLGSDDARTHPLSVDDSTDLAQAHRSVNDFAEQPLPAFGAQRDKIGRGACVVESLPAR